MMSTRSFPEDRETPARLNARADEEYRIKLYKVACGAARERREQLRLDWEARNRERR